MIVIDANILIYSYDTGSPDHTKSREWIETVFLGKEIVGLPWQVIAAFLRVLTNRRLAGQRLSPEEAAGFVDEWLALPNIRLLLPSDRFWGTFRSLMIDGGASGPLVSDTEIAALTIEHGGVLYTVDRDFARFPGLRWKNPLT